MRFYEKLNLLMSLQSVPNNKLAKALSVDPSLISRWRNGSRDIAKNSEYLVGIADYFAKHACDKESLFEILDFPTSQDISNDSQLAEKIWTWLLDEHAINTSIADKFVTRLNQVKNINLQHPIIDVKELLPIGKKLNIEVFHGNEGKRQGVIKLLTATILSKKKCTLLLYSDEPLDWMTEDSDFYNKWVLLLSETIRCGHKVKIIHTIDRNIDELLTAIDRWLPLYLSGAIEPYYYPNYQDVIFKRTMFIVPGVAALTSSTLSEAISSEQLYYHDAQMLTALEEEFESYLEHCRPLMRIFTKAHLNDFHLILDEFERRFSDTFLLSHTPSFSTLPENLLRKCIDESHISESEQAELLNYHNQRLNAFESNLQEHKHFEWLTLPKIECMKAGNYHYSGPQDSFFMSKVEFDNRHYVDHVENILYHLKSHKHYHVRLTNLLLPNDMIIEVKRDIGVLVCKMDASPVYIAFNHAIMTNAFLSFVEKYTGSNFSDSQNKSNVIREIEEWLDAVKKI